MIPPERRVGEAMTLIAQGRWFSLVSGRQTGKTTVTQSLAERLTAQGEQVRTVAGSEGLEVLLLAGQPLGEPVARYGPFVMNTKQELVEAYEDFQAGRMGVIAP